MVSHFDQSIEPKDDEPVTTLRKDPLCKSFLNHQLLGENL